MKNVLYLIFAVVLLIQCSCDKIAGTVSDTETGKAAMVYNEDLTPAAGAGVWFFEVNDTVSAYETKTDKNGHYIIPALAKGTYNIIARKDSAIAFQDSVFISSTSNTISPDTLGKSGSITGIVGLQPNHDPRTVTVQVLGTNVYSSVTADGWFTLMPLAKGEYNLRIVTTLPDYSPTFARVKVQSGKKDTLSDTLLLIYTGIPVVSGLRATYDTLNGIAHLTWNKASYRDLQDYLIYRDDFEVINLSDLPIAARGDTVFTDTVFNRKLPSGTFSSSDTNDYRFKYRVAVRSNVNTVGNTYKYIGITAASPVDVKTTFSFLTYHMVKGFKTDSASVNDSLLYTVKFNNPTRCLRKITWTDLSKGTVIYSHALDSTKKFGSDTIKYIWNKTAEKKIECKVRDNGGTDWRDTCTIMVVKDAPVVSISTPKYTVAVGDTIRLGFYFFDKFGTVDKRELSTGNSGVFKSISGYDTIVIVPNLLGARFNYIVRVTDDDGNISCDTLSIKANLFRLVKDSAQFSDRYGHTTVVFKNRMYLIGGGNDGYTHIFNDVWSSDNGFNWVIETDSAAFPSRIFHTCIVFDNKMWIIGGAGKSNFLNDVWYSSDGKTWTEATNHAGFSERHGHSSIVFDNKMWIIGGFVDGVGAKNDVWYSSDGITWLLANKNAEFGPRYHHSTLVFDNKMWVIGGDIWYTSDGNKWVSASDVDFGGQPIVVYDKKMWAIGSSFDRRKNDIWVSENGSEWRQLIANDNFSPRNGHTCTSFLGKIWVIGGYTNAQSSYDYLNDVWCYNPNL